MIATLSLLVFAAASAIGARRIARSLAAELPTFGAGALAAALPVGLFLSVVPLVGRWLRDFDAGLAGGAIAAVVLLAASRRLGAPRVESQPAPRRITIAFVLAMAAVAALYGYVSWRYQMHDEQALFGHKSMVEQLRRGEYPVYLPPLPSQDARYHYGFDVLAGALARGFGLGTDLAIDLVTVAMALLLSAAAAAIAADLGARGASPFAAVAIHLGAGLAFVMLAGVEGRHPRCLVQYHHPSCNMELFPTPFLNVFQHPVSCGVPLLFVVLLLARRVLETRGPVSPWAWLLLAVLPGLGIAQVVYFSLGALAIGAAVPPWLTSQRGRLRVAFARAVLLGALLGIGFALTWLAGGMFTPSPVTDPTLFARRAIIGFPSGYVFPQVLRHHVINLGLGFVLLPIFLIVALVKRNPILLALVAFASGGIIVPHFWEYSRSWDIVKFPSASAFALTMLVVVLVDAHLAQRPSPWSWLRRLERALLCGSGFTAAVFVIFPLEGDLRLYDPHHATADPQVAKTIRFWLDRGYDRQELIYVQSNIAPELAVYGGLSAVGSDYDFWALGIKQEVLAEQQSLANRVRASMDRDALRELGVRWIMLSDEEIENLGPPARAVLRDEKSAVVELAATFPADPKERTRRIWRVR